MTNAKVQRLINKECRKVRRRGWKIPYNPRMEWLNPDCRKLLRQFPDRVPDLVEAHRKLEHV